MSKETSLQTESAQEIAPTQPHQSKLYTMLAPFYDTMFFFIYGHVRSAIREEKIGPGEKILEIGVGTGASFSAYPKHCSVLGVDIAAPMLDRAQQKIARHQWEHIKVKQMSALDLELPDSSMDRIIAFHVVSVVPDIDRMMRELSRVCRPNGTLIVLNNFCGESAGSQTTGALLDPVTRRLGWSSTLTQSALFERSNFRVESAQRTSPLSPYWLVRATNQK